MGIRRREFIKRATLAGAAFSLSGLSEHSLAAGANSKNRPQLPSQTMKPNILLIHSDQHRYDCVGAHGLRKIHTPCLDKLIAQGTTFSQAFVTIPICMAARASLATGAWPTAHGSLAIPSAELDRPARPELPTLFPLLQSSGYRVNWVGKYHGELDCSYPGLAQGVDDFVHYGEYHAYCKEQGIKEEKHTKGLFGDENTEQDPAKTSIAWQADVAISMMKKSREAGKPFFLRWDPPQPHLPCCPASKFASLYDANEIPPWTSFPDSLEGKPYAQGRQQRIWGIEGWGWEKWAPIVRLYYGIISEMDFHIGRILDSLEEQGLAENTIVIYSTDHGDFCGGHGLLDKHFSFYEDIARVPLIIRAPGKIVAGAQCQAYSSNSIDIAKTILDLAGCEAQKTFVGKNLIEMANGSDPNPRDYAYAQYLGTESGSYSCRMIRDTRYKFVYHPTAEIDELYDLQDDPGELHNLAGSADYADIEKRLRAALWDTMKSCGDRLANWWTAVELKGAPNYAAKFGL